MIGGFEMKRVLPIFLCILMTSAAALAQTPEETIARALAAAPRQMREGATVVQWKADFTYETLKKGTNRLFCYDRSGEPGRQPFAVQCTSIGNFDRVAQNRKFEAMSDKAAKQLGGLREEAFRRTGTRTALSGPLHPSRRHLQPSSGRGDRYARLVPLEGLRPP